MALIMETESARRLSAEDAAALVRSGDWLDYGAVLAQPDAFDKALAARVGELRNVNIRGCLSLRPRAVLEADPEREHFNFFNWHLGGYDRKLSDAGRQNYIPCNLGEIPDYYRRFIDPPEIMVIKTCPVDANGYFNFGPANLWHGAVASRAKIVIVETDPALPYVHGIENGLHMSQVDYVIEGDGQPVPELPSPAPTDADRAVARLIAAEINDGACLQIGIGAMPNAVCSLLMESGVRNLGIHTEMLTDGIIDLYKAGVVTGAAKTSHPGKIVCSFGLGSKHLYDTIDHNPDIACQPVDVTNLPHLVMKNDRLTTINNTTQMDLQGQAASESSGHRHISGSGGQLQFVRAGYASNGGKSFICMSSTYERAGVRRSRIVLDLTPGNVVTAPRSDMMFVVTEYGLVNLKGKSIPERAKAMISLAHPDFRDDLEREARTNGLIPRSFARQTTGDVTYRRMGGDARLPAAAAALMGAAHEVAVAPPAQERCTGMITIDTVDDVSVLRLGHGKVNALDVELLDELTATLDAKARSSRAIVLTGNGRVFSAGVDLTRVLDSGADYVARLIPALSRAFVTLFTLPRPVVAAIDGAAIAGGCILAAACDVRLMAEGSGPIGATELVVGVPFPVAALEILHHACGYRTADIVLRARRLDVAEAVAVGLVQQALPPEVLVDRAVALAADLGALPGEAYAMAKRQLQQGTCERIERDAPSVDAAVAQIWASSETAGRITEQLARLRSPRP